jgi:hypothetical protein
MSTSRHQKFGFPPKEGDIEIESLRTVVVALTQKLKAQSVQDVTITNLNEQLTLSENARLALQQQLGQLTSEVITRGE